MLRANIMLLGRSGAGKSEFVNYLLNDNIAPTGCGEPVTASFDEYEYKLQDDFAVKIYDSKGLEVNQFKDIRDGILSFVAEKNRSECASDWIHAIFYCINIERSRLGKEEEQLISDLKEVAGNVIIIITHCHNPSDSNVISMERKIFQDLGIDTKIFCVNSVSEKKRTGEVLHQFGKELLVKNLEQILWDNTARNISEYYALELITGMNTLVEKMRCNIIGVIDSSSRRQLKRELNNQTLFNAAWEDSFDATKKYIEETNAKYDQLINEYAEICRHVNNAVNNQIIEKCSPLHFSYDALFGDEVEEEMKAAFERKLKQLEEEKIEDGIDAIIVIADYLVNYYRELFKEPLNEFFDAMKARIPSKETISRDVFEMLQKARRESMNHIPKVRLLRKIGLNEPCPCGSGKKYKKCCRGKGIYE